MSGVLAKGGQRVPPSFAPDRLGESVATLIPQPHERRSPPFGWTGSQPAAGSEKSLQPCRPALQNLRCSFHPAQYVVDRLTSHPDQLTAHNTWNKIRRNGINRGGRLPVQTFAKDRRHRSGQGLHLRPQRDPEGEAAIIVAKQKHSDRISAFLVFAHIFENVSFAYTRRVQFSLVGVNDEILPFLGIIERFEKGNNLLEGWRVWGMVHGHLKVLRRV